jgi:hypothetical protein
VVNLLVATSGPERGLISTVDEVERAIERFRAATRAFLCFAVALKRWFGENHKWVSKRLRHNVRVNFLVLESVIAMRAN